MVFRVGSGCCTDLCVALSGLVLNLQFKPVAYATGRGCVDPSGHLARLFFALLFYALLFGLPVAKRDWVGKRGAEFAG